MAGLVKLRCGICVVSNVRTSRSSMGNSSSCMSVAIRPIFAADPMAIVDDLGPEQ